MSRLHILTRPIQLHELTFDELYEEASKDWRKKAERLQARRWHHLRNQSRSNHKLNQMRRVSA